MTLLALLSLLLAGACSGDDAGEPAPPVAPSPAAGSPTTGAPAGPGAVQAVEVAQGEDLYAAPDQIPDAPHGTLLRYQEITPSVTGGARTWRIMYVSESLEGDSIVVTGAALVPTGDAPPEGRVVLAIAHGTTGIADVCAPSRAPQDSELGLLTSAVERGWLVVQTDYEGLGGPGRHPYLVGESEGRSVVDAVLAAGSLPDAERGEQVAVAGYSQGGHGALWASQVAVEWAPDLDVVGTFAGAPATEIPVILEAAPRLPTAGFTLLIAAGYAAAYPAADPAAILTDEGVDQLALVDDRCIVQIFQALEGVPSTALVEPDAAEAEPWPDLAAENNPGQVALPDPVLIIHSEQDEIVPVELSELLMARICDHGQVAERRVISAGGHREAARPAYRDGLDWLAERLAGEQPVDDCAAG